MTNDNSPSVVLVEIIDENSYEPEDLDELEQSARRKREQLEQHLLQQHIDLQKSWSRQIGWLLIGSTIAIWLMIFGVGIGRLGYQSYPWFPHTVVGTFFAQVVGLGLVVAKYVFSFPSSSNFRTSSKKG